MTINDGASLNWTYAALKKLEDAIPAVDQIEAAGKEAHHVGFDDIQSIQDVRDQVNDLIEDLRDAIDKYETETAHGRPAAE